MDDAVRVVEAQIGRPARGDVTVCSSCEFGLPMVVRTAPVLDDGTPFPTLYWLTCPLAGRAIGRLESNGYMRELNARLQADQDLARDYAAAHVRYKADRGAGEAMTESAGGMPGRVKCLHALYAHEKADANPIGAMVRERIEPLGCPGPCVAMESDGKARRVAGHPGFKGAR